MAGGKGGNTRGGGVRCRGGRSGGVGGKSATGGGVGGRSTTGGGVDGRSRTGGGVDGRSTTGGGVGGKSTTGGGSVGGKSTSHGKLPASDGPSKQPPSAGGRKHPASGMHGGSSSSGAPNGFGAEGDGFSPTPRGTSSHDSNRNTARVVSPPSQGNVSSSRTNQVLPLQYPTSANRNGSHRTTSQPQLNMNLEPHRRSVEFHEEEDGEDEGEEEEGEEEEGEEEEGEEVDGGNEGAGDDLEAAVNGFGLNPNVAQDDYEQMLNNVLAHPGRQGLTYLSEHPIPNRRSLWYVLI